MSRSDAILLFWAIVAALAFWIIGRNQKRNRRLSEQRKKYVHDHLWNDPEHLEQYALAHGLKGEGLREEEIHDVLHAGRRESLHRHQL